MKKLLIVSGYSGAGKSVTLKALEDAGYEAVDNIPLPALPAVVAALESSGTPVAIGLDIRSRGFTPEEFIATISGIWQQATTEHSLLFLSCETEVLLGRFKETRRPHPLAPDRPVLDGIHAERALLEPVRKVADEVLDTSDFIARALQQRIQQMFSLGERAFYIQLVSFSYRGGVPREADLVFDVRFLRNPHYDEALRPLTGQAPEVASHIIQDEGYVPFFGQLHGLLELLIPRYREEGKRLLTIAVGCTGGRHRSVFVAEELARVLTENGHTPTIRHRELDEG